MGYLTTGQKRECVGCEACRQICDEGAINFEIDIEGFFYPNVDAEKCIGCKKCIAVCPMEVQTSDFSKAIYVFGGYSLDENIRFESTSGGAFTEIAKIFLDEESEVFGVTSDGINVRHIQVNSVEDLRLLRKSKYSQSRIGDSYKEVQNSLMNSKRVLFSGTPCQIAGLKSFLGKEYENLLTVEVVCEGVPSLKYIEKYVDFCEEKYSAKIKSFDYRYKGKSIFLNGKWDFEVEKIDFVNGKSKITDRWFNPFWSIWIDHLMSRPSCYGCQYAKKERIADVTLGDLWGVHLYCPELYGKNGGASLVFANTQKGLDVVEKATQNMFGHELRFEEAVKYQGPMRNPISENSNREHFMSDLINEVDYETLVSKWWKKPTAKLIFDKYIWGNRQKMTLWNIKKRVR